MKKLLFPTILSCLLFSAVATESVALPPSQQIVVNQVAATTESMVKILAERHGPRMVRSRYMEKNAKPVEWKNYEGYPTIHCRYPMRDRATSTTKEAEVVMLNPDPERVARWIITALETVKGRATEEDADKFYRHVISQSGGQFPVAGVVYEDMEGDGYQKAYVFRDGVTVRVDGVTHRTTAPLTQDEIHASLHGNVNRVYTYGRICSTNPEMYKANGGKLDVGDNKERKPEWLTAVRTEYLKAWNSERNMLFDAWAKHHFAEK